MKMQRLAHWELITKTTRRKQKWRRRTLWRVSESWWQNRQTDQANNSHTDRSGISTSYTMPEFYWLWEMIHVAYLIDCRSQIWNNTGAHVWGWQTEHEVQGGEVSEGPGLHKGWKCTYCSYPEILCVNLSNFFISCFKKSHWMFERGIRTRKIIHITCVTKCCFIWVDLSHFVTTCM